MSATAQTKAADFQVADLELADWGRKEIAIAETEMPGLMAIREEYAKAQPLQGRPHHGLAAHDDPDRGPDRDAQGPRRRRALGLVQHLLDPGPRRGRHREGRHRGLRLQGRVARGVLGLHPPHLRVARRRLDQHDPRRRRRRHPAAPPRREGGEGRLGPRQPPQRGGARPLRRHQEAPRRAARLVLEAARVGPRRDRGDDHRRPPPLPDAREGRPEDPRHQRQRLRHQVEVRQPVRLPRVAGGRHQARDRRDDRGQDRPRVRLRRRGQGLGPGPARPLRPGLGDRDRPHLRAAGGDGGLPRGDDGLRGGQGRHLRDRHRQLPRDPPRPHGEDEGPGHRLQHRPLRQRDRRRLDRGLPLGGDQAAGGPRDLPRRQADHPARQGPPGEPRLRHRPPVVRDVLVLRQPDDRPDRAVEGEGQRQVPGGRLHPAQAPRREGRAAAAQEAEREAHRADGAAGHLHRRRQAGAVQERPSIRY